MGVENLVIVYNFQVTTMSESIEDMNLTKKHLEYQTILYYFGMFRLTGEW